jgi:oligoribonuclease NrnB/cAMP/cGMP phosphodiesterase (DHH superfamily)
MKEWIQNRHTRVLNITHKDLDGVVAGMIVKKVYPNSILVYTNYSGPDFVAAIDAIQHTDMYDAIVFSDFCPQNEMLEALRASKKPYLIIDHHQTAEAHPEDPYGEFYIVQGRCGALLCYEYFKDMADLENMRQLCVVTNDHDLWIRKLLPISDDLNTLLYEYGFEEFATRFADGLEPDGTLPEDAKALLATHEAEVNEYMAQCPEHELPYNGHYIECEKFNSDINKRLTPQYDWLVMAGTEGVDPGMTKLSFRTRRKDINIGATLKGLGRGGGGHPAAAGQVIPTAERDEFIQQVGDLLFGAK